MVGGVDEAAVDPDVGKTVVEIVKARGYTIETPTRKVNRILPAVHLQHGLLDSSFSFVCNFRNQSMPFVLADAGFDVWLGNNRGTTWSREHLDYTTDDDAFWDFTWEDMGLYDLPAFVNTILDTTGRTSVSYIGHSERTTQAFVGFSKNQKVSKKVDYFGALAPVAWTGHVSAESFVALAKLKLNEAFLNLGFSSFLPHSDTLMALLSAIVCTNLAEQRDSASGLIAEPSSNLNTTRIPVCLSQTPAGTSARNVGHYARDIRDGTFASYAYGCSCLRILGDQTLLFDHLQEQGRVRQLWIRRHTPLETWYVYPRTGFDVGATSNDIAQMRSKRSLQRSQALLLTPV